MNINTFNKDMAFSPIFTASELSHAYIISGSDDADRLALAKTIASAIVCESGDKRPCGKCSQCKKALRDIHPDITIIEKPKDKANIPVDTIRHMCADAAVIPNDASAKVYIIPDASLLLAQAQNAMLKTLEEPPGATSFIICAENPGMLLDTVRSRCVEIVLTGSTSVSEGQSRYVRAFFDALTQGNTAICAFSFSLDKLDKQPFADFLQQAYEYAGVLLRRAETGETISLSIPRLVKTVEVLQKALDYSASNINKVHVAGFLSAALTEQK